MSCSLYLLGNTQLAKIQFGDQRNVVNCKIGWEKRARLALNETGTGVHSFHLGIDERFG